LLNLLLKILLVLVGIAAVLAIAVWLYLQQAQFANPTIDTRQLSGRPSVTGTTRYNDEGKFENIETTEVMVEDDPGSQQPRQKSGLFRTLYKFVFEEIPGAVPEQPLPSQKTDLASLDRNDNVVIWMGHSSYYIQLDGKRILVDPVFSAYASPVPGTNVAFKGSNIYSAEDIPELDLLLISHDHWDHLDFPTLQGLKEKVKQVVTPLGVGSYLTQWGWPDERVFEGEWGSIYHGDGINVHILPSRHFSGRLLDRNRTLWGSFALVTAKHRYYISGDTGYGEHFKKIGDALGPFDLAILECGQYNVRWANIHMMPEQAATAALELKSRAVLAAHNSKFKLAYHPWKEPLERISRASEGKPYRLLTPLIGERVEPDNQQQEFGQWWLNVK